MFKRILAGSTLSLITLIVNMFVAMAMMPFIIHTLGHNDYGLWVLVASFIGYYSLLDFGMSSAAMRFISRADGQGDTNEMNIILNSSTAFFMTLGVSVFLISAIGATITPFLTGDDIFVIQVLWFSVGITCIFQFGLRGFYGLYFARIRQDILSYTTFAKTIIRTGLIIYFLNGGYGVISLAIIAMATEIVTYGIDMYILRKICPEMKLSLSLVKMDRIKALLKYGIFSMMNQVSNLMRLRVLPMIVTLTSGVVYVVYFNIAMRLMEIYWEIINKVIGILTPVFSQYEGTGNTEGIKQIFWVAFRINIALSVLVGGCIILFSNPFITWWIGEDYNLAIELTVWLAVGFLAFTIQETGKTILLGISKHQLFSSISAVESIIGAIIGTALGFAYGPVWIVAGMTGSMLVFELLIKPAIVANAIEIPLVKYYMVLAEVTVKVGTPIVAYGILMENWMTCSMVNVLLSATGLCIISAPFIWFSMNKTAKDLIISKLPSTYRKGYTNG